MSLRVFYFGADWCKACHEKRPLVEQVCKEYDIPLLYADIDKELAKKLAVDLGIRSIPYVLVQDFPEVTNIYVEEAPFAFPPMLSEMTREELGIVYSAVGGMINRAALEARFKEYGAENQPG